MTARLIVMDIDSTLINQEVIDLLGEEAGVGEQVAQITDCLLYTSDAADD